MGDQGIHFPVAVSLLLPVPSAVGGGDELVLAALAPQHMRMEGHCWDA